MLASTLAVGALIVHGLVVTATAMVHAVNGVIGPAVTSLTVPLAVLPVVVVLSYRTAMILISIPGRIVSLTAGN